MGMAASQARLLSITARIHDVEYEAQSIQSAKVSLATQSDKAYSDYLDALDSTTLTITKIDPASGEKASITATFNNLCGKNKVLSADGNNYALKFKGALIVQDDIYDGYNDFLQQGYEDSPYMFALYMLDQINANGQDAINAENSVYNSIANNTDDYSSQLKELHDKLITLSGTEENDIYDTSLLTPENEEKYNETLAYYQHMLYDKYAPQIFASANNNEVFPEDLNQNLFDYYVNIYNQIKASNDNCVPISDFDGPSGNAADNSDWLKSMVECGQVSIETVKTNRTNGKIDMNGTSPSSDSSLSFTQTTSIDKKALTKAQAEYEHKLSQINHKDKKYDLELSKLETERKALTTEYDSVKKVIEDNIDRTFGIFS